MNTISKLALACVVTLFFTHVTYGMRPEPKVIMLFDAIENNNLELACLLLESDNGIDLKKKDNDGWTPLHYACCYCHTAVFTFIVEKNPKLLQEKSNSGLTPLHYACWNDCTETIKLLLLYGADFNVVNNHKQKPLKPLMLCGKKTRTEICNYIKELASDTSLLLSQLCKHNKVFAQQVLTFLMIMKSLKKTKHHFFNVPKPLIFMMVTMLDLNQEIDNLIKKWTT